MRIVAGSWRNAHGIRDYHLAPLPGRFVSPLHLNGDLEGSLGAFLNSQEGLTERTVLLEASAQLFIFLAVAIFEEQPQLFNAGSPAVKR
jgi:hypothetical protein